MTGFDNQVKREVAMLKKAFTLIEMLVCISIVAILLSLLIPQISQARAVASQTLCASYQRQVGVSFAVYMHDYRNWVPRLLGNITEVTSPVRQSVSRPFVASTASQHVERLFPINIRYCPSYGVRSTVGGLHHWTYVSPILHNNQVGQQWNSYLLWHRTTPDEAYVRLVETKLINQKDYSAINPANAEHKYYNNNRNIYPLRSFPLLVDMLQTNASGTPRRAAAHNGARAYSSTVQNIDSQGANHLWMDGSVSWKKWPDRLKAAMPTTYGADLRQYPHERASGYHPEGWVGSGNNYYIQYFWVKN